MFCRCVEGAQCTVLLNVGLQVSGMTVSLDRWTQPEGEIQAGLPCLAGNVPNWKVARNPL